MEGHILSLHQIRCEKEQKNLQESERIFPAVLFLWTLFVFYSTPTSITVEELLFQASMESGKWVEITFS